MKNFKFLKRLLILAAVVFIFSFCKKENDENTVSAPDIFYKWKIDSVMSVTYVNDTPNGYSYMSAEPHSIKFRTDFTVLYTFLGNRDSFPFRLLPGNRVEMDIDQNSTPENYVLIKNMTGQMLMERTVRDTFIGQMHIKEIEDYYLHK